jgi:poly(3-hydroxybutyrate) depolymerase
MNETRPRWRLATAGCWLFVVVLALPGCRRRAEPARAVAPVAIASASAGPCVAALGSALPTCSPHAPCTDLKGTTITTNIDIPADCRSAKRIGGAGFDDGLPRRFSDAVSGEARAACVYVPPTASASSLVPLVVFLHGSFGSASSVYGSTELRAKAVSSVLGGDPGVRGFILASPQGRNLHWPEGRHFDGSHEDVYRVDLASPSSNADVRSLDLLIDDLVGEGRVDPKRIYVMGWSNGATFANLYAVARHETATPRGHKVAAAAVYAGADPFRGGECIKTGVPLLEVHRDCDALVPCDDAQRARMGIVPGGDTRGFLAHARGSFGDANAAELLLDADGRDVAACAAADACGEIRGLANHMRWPTEREEKMLAFLREHALP